jgi:hypothetical protein
MLAGVGIKAQALVGGWNQWVATGGPVASASK